LGTTAVVLWLPSVRRLGGDTQTARSPGIWRWTIGRIDPEIEHVRQHRMNGASLISAIVVLVVLVYRVGSSVLALVIVIAMLTYLGALARRRWGVR